MAHEEMTKKGAQKTGPTIYEDDASGDLFLIYGKDGGVTIDIRFEGETLWMSQAQIAELFGVTVPTINEHIQNIFREGELDEKPTIRNFRIVRPEGARQVAREIKHYNLDVIISAGYRVNSKQGTIFRRWATDRLVQFATHGFVIDKQRLMQPDASDRIAELREIIRDIRSDESNVYRELRSICAMCQDYDGASEKWREFYQHIGQADVGGDNPIRLRKSSPNALMRHRKIWVCKPGHMRISASLTLLFRKTIWPKPKRVNLTG